MINRLAKTVSDRFRSAAANSLGITLIETIVALSIFASAGVAVLVGVSAAHTSSDVTYSSSVAENLARNQMEYVWTQDFIPRTPAFVPYDSIVDDSDFNIPSGFSVTAVPTLYGVYDDDLAGDIQLVTVTVYRSTDNDLINDADEIVHVLETLRSGPYTPP